MVLQTESKEDTFFDSKTWLDSELEDEFFSVNGGKCMSSLFSEECNHLYCP